MDGFKFIDGEIHAASSRIFRDSPRRLMRVFLHAQQRRLKLHPDLAQLIRNQLSLVDRDFLNDEHVRETFLTILDRRGEVAPILRAMHEVNLLGKYIPEFGKLTCLVQHEFYHQYAADEHTLVCLEQLDKIWEAQEPPYKNYAPLFQGLERPGLLYLALLLHDVGKAEGHKKGGHAEVSADMAMRAAKRLQLDGSAAHTLRLIIENHLLMASAVAAARPGRCGGHPQFCPADPDAGKLEPADAADLRRFAGHQRQTVERLQGFAAVAVAFPRHGAADRRHGIPSAPRKSSANSCAGSPRTGAAAASATRSWTRISPRCRRAYFQDPHGAGDARRPRTHAPVHAPADSAKSDRALSPVIAWMDEPDRGYNVVKICTWDRAGLFSKIAGSFSAAGLNILSAQIFTRTDGIALDTFFVNDARTGNLADPRAARQICRAAGKSADRRGRWTCPR